MVRLKLLLTASICFVLFLLFNSRVNADTSQVIQELFLNKSMYVEDFSKCEVRGNNTYCPIIVNPENGQPVTDDVFTCGCPNISENDRLEDCVYTVEEWKASPIKRHVYIPDPESTTILKSNIRAQQLLDWVMRQHNPINFIGITSKWKESESIALLIIINVIALTSIIFIIHQLFNTGKQLDIPGRISKIVLSIVFTLFSFTLASGLTQLSDMLSSALRGGATADSLTRMTRFDSKKSVDNDKTINYQNIVCQNLNIGSLEQAKTIKEQTQVATVTYNVLAYLHILRILLSWFLIIIAPIVIVFYTFTFGKHVLQGWLFMFIFVWIYGPMQAILLNIVHSLWNKGIPFAFYANTNGSYSTFPPALIEGYIGGPSQANTVSYINNISNISTYAEFVTGICMLWLAIVLPFILIFFVRGLFNASSESLQSQFFTIYEYMTNSMMRRGSGSSGKDTSMVNIPFIKKNTLSTMQTNTSNFTTNQLAESADNQINSYQTDNTSIKGNLINDMIENQHDYFDNTSIDLNNILSKEPSAMSFIQSKKPNLRENEIRSVFAHTNAKEIYTTYNGGNTESMVNNIQDITSLNPTTINDILSSSYEFIQNTITSNTVEEISKSLTVSNQTVYDALALKTNFTDENNKNIPKEVKENFANTHKLSEDKVEKLFEKVENAQNKKVAKLNSKNALIEDTIEFKTTTPEHLKELKDAWIHRFKEDPKLIQNNLQIAILHMVLCITHLLSKQNDIVDEGTKEAKQELGQELFSQIDGEELFAVLYGKIKALRFLSSNKELQNIQK